MNALAGYIRANNADYACIIVTAVIIQCATVHLILTAVSGHGIVCRLCGCSDMASDNDRIA